MALLFVENGASVLVVDVIQTRVDQVVQEARAKAKQRVEGMTIDLSQEDGPDKMVDFALKTFGKVDILCNNAGIMDGVLPVGDTTDEVWERVLAVNLDAPFKATRRVIPDMLKNGGGVIINTASVAGLYGGFAGAAYTASKHGLIGLTKSTASHYGSRGIRCNAMVLGGVNTNIGVGAKAPDPKGMEHLMKVTPLMTRTADPTEIAELALFLASNRSGYINGSSIVIDGGWTAF